MDEWNLENVHHCSLRRKEKRIMEDIYDSVRQHGVVIYSTCSFSKEENEDILDHLKENHSIDSIPLLVPDDWGVVEVTSDKHHQYGYRFFPIV